MCERTDAPGSTRDEDVASLDSALKLPPWLYEDREFPEERLPAVEVDGSRETTEAD